MFISQTLCCTSVQFYTKTQNARKSSIFIHVSNIYFQHGLDLDLIIFIILEKECVDNTDFHGNLFISYYNLMCF